MHIIGIVEHFENCNNTESIENFDALFDREILISELEAIENGNSEYMFSEDEIKGAYNKMNARVFEYKMLEAANEGYLGMKIGVDGNIIYQRKISEAELFEWVLNKTKPEEYQAIMAQAKEDIKSIRIYEDISGVVKVSLCDVCNYLGKYKLVGDSNHAFWELSRRIFEKLADKELEERNGWDWPLIIDLADVFMDWTWYGSSKFEDLLTINNLNGRIFKRLIYTIDLREDIKKNMCLVTDLNKLIGDYKKKK